MIILIVEDDDNKRVQLESFIRDTFPGVVVETAKAFQSGLRALIAKEYDLVLLDMSMPTFDPGRDEDGGRPQAYAGRELLRQMDRRSINTRVVVVTAYQSFGKEMEVVSLSELDRQLAAEHPQSYYGSVYYDSSVSGWRESLSAIIHRVEAERS